MNEWLFIVPLTGLLWATAWLQRGKHTLLRIPARYDSIRDLTSLVSQFVRAAKLGERAEFECRLAIDEACVNIIEHAYDNDPVAEIEVMVKATLGLCEIHLTDFGLAYDPQLIAPPPIGIILDQARPGGFGLHLMQQMMDEVNYTTGPNGNRLIMVKRRAS